MIKKYPAVLIATHADGHNDGCASIVYHLAQKYRAMMVGGSLYGKTYSTLDLISFHATTLTPGTIFLEAGFPATAAGIVGAAHIPPQVVSHVLLLVDAVTFDADPYGNRIRSIAERNGATAVGLGNIWSFDPPSHGVESFDDLTQKTLSLINFVEQYLRLPVPFLSTSSETVVDREPYPIHETPDPTRVVKIGTPE